MGKADEIFNKIPHLGRDGHYFHISKTSVIGAMEEYAKDLKQSRDTWEHISQELRADLELKVNQILRLKNLVDAYNDEAINLFDQSYILAGNNKAETLIKADTIAKIVDELKLILE